MNSIKKAIKEQVDTSEVTWSEEQIEKVHLKVLYQLARALSDYDISFIEKLDSEENGISKIEDYLKEKGIDLEEIVNKEIAFIRAH